MTRIGLRQGRDVPRQLSLLYRSNAWAPAWPLGLRVGLNLLLSLPRQPGQAVQRLPLRLAPEIDARGQHRV